MMSKIVKLAFLIWMAGVLCGCGRREDVVIIGREEAGREEAGREEAGREEAGREEAERENTGSVLLAASEAYAAEAEGFAEGTEKQAGLEIYVHVCGAVENPGVVELEAGSRARDALEAAGGFSEAADKSYVNLAAEVLDGEKLYFPTVSEAMEAAEAETAKSSGLVNINTADMDLLCTLPGIGEARAQSIIAYREQHGVFQTEEDIMKVSGIKAGAFEKIRDKITVK